MHATAPQPLSEEARALCTLRVLGRAEQARARAQPTLADLGMQISMAALADSCWGAAPFPFQYPVLGAFPRLTQGHITTALVALHSRMHSSSEGRGCIAEQDLEHKLVAVPRLQLTDKLSDLLADTWPQSWPFQEPLYEVCPIT